MLKGFETAFSVEIHIGSVTLSLIIWGTCGVVSITGALCFIELGTSIRKSGIDFAYQTYVGWNALAFSLVLTQTLLQFPSSIAIQLKTITYYLIEGIELHFCLSDDAKYFTQAALGMVVLYLLSFLNFYSLEKYAAKVQVASFFVKVVSLLFISGVGFYYFSSSKAEPIFENGGFEGTTLTLKGVVSALYSGFWAYSGWDCLNYGLEDIKNPQKALSVAAVGGLVTVTFLYLLTNIAYFAVLGVQGSLASNAVVVTFVNNVFGTHFADAVPIIVGLMTATSLNTGLFTTSRMFYAASRGGHLPSFLSGLNPSNESPRPAIFTMCVLATVFMLIGDLEILMGYVNFVGWLTHGVSVAAMLWIRYKNIPVDPRAIKMPIIIHVVFLLVTAYLILIPIYEKPIVGGVAIGIVFLGIVIYFAAVRNPKLPSWLISFDRKILTVTQILFVVASKRQVSEKEIIKQSSTEDRKQSKPEITRF